MSPRLPQETAWVTLRTQRLSVFELQARAILGLAVDTMMISPGAARVIDRAAPRQRSLFRRAGRCARCARKRRPGVRAQAGGGAGHRARCGTARDRARQVRTRWLAGTAVSSPGLAEYARLTRVSYAGDITPLEAWKLLSDNPQAVLVDVRTDAEWRFVGVPDLSSLGRDVVYIEWNTSEGRITRTSSTN